MVTDFEGNFSLDVPRDAKMIFISYVGLKTKEVPVASLINVVLDSDSKALDEVVVTAMGLTREKKALGYALQEVKSDELTKAGQQSLATSLSGKIAGVQITSQGGQVGASQNIVVRGNSSFGNNQPLIVVDGVPIANDNAKGATVNLGSGLNDINPEDIESISVLKGGSAALYGMRAGNGVILVTTKSGKKDNLAERGRNAKWIRKPTNTLRLAPLEKEAQNLDAADASMEEILEDTEKNTQLVLKMRGESYPVRDCAIRTILSRAGVNGDGLRKLDKATYAKVVNYCLRVAKGDALIKIADGKVSAVHGGDKHDYCILDMKAMFETTCEYLNLNFKGSVYMEGSGIYDHSIVSAMWKLGGSQELLDTYRKALDAHGMDEKILSPALRFTTSDVAASGANLYPMLLTDGPNGVISLGSPIKLAHDKGATILDFRKNLEQVCARYVDAMKNLTQLMDIEIRNPVNCLKLLMKELGIKQKIRNEVVELFVSQNGEGACTAHDLYYAMNEASFFAACEGMSGQGILKLEEDITKALIKDWKKYDVYGAVKC